MNCEYLIVASRGRDKTGGGEKESFILSAKRTDYGKAIRKAYENHEIHEKRAYIQQLEPRTDGITNTITTVQKDNLVLEIWGQSESSKPQSKGT